MQATSIALSAALLEETEGMGGAETTAARGLVEEILHPTEERISSVVDPEAHMGHKSPQQRFVGYKLHVAEHTSELVTTVQVLSGNQHEGTHLTTLLEEEQVKGVTQSKLVADALYDSAASREVVRAAGATPHIPRRKHRTVADRFAYDEATDTLRCPQGHHSTHREQLRGGTRYDFSADVCRGCPVVADCPPPNSGRVRVRVSERQLLRTKGEPSDAPPVEYERKRIERKFGQAKTNHGLRWARYLGKAKPLIQGLLTFFVLNAKRWVRLLDLRAAAAAQAAVAPA